MDKTVVVQLKALSKLGAAGRAAHTKLQRDLQRVRQHRQAGSHGDAHRIGGRRSRPSKRPLRITRASPRLHRFLHAVVAAGGAGMSSQEEAELHTKLELAEHEAAMQAGTFSEADMRLPLSAVLMQSVGIGSRVGYRRGSRRRAASCTGDGGSGTGHANTVRNDGRPHKCCGRTSPGPTSIYVVCVCVVCTPGVASRMPCPVVSARCG